MINAYTQEQQITDKYIVQRVREALLIMKDQQQNEELRQQRRLVLTAIAPESKGVGDTSGMQKKVAERLSINRNLAPFRDSVAKRAEIDADWQAMKDKAEFSIGDSVLCKHGAGELVEIAENGSCKVKIVVDGFEHTSEFSSMSNKKGGARLRNPLVSFAPKARKQRNPTSVSEDVKERVQQCYEAGCAVSPCAKDRVRIRKGPFAYLIMPALILLSTFGALHASLTVGAAVGSAVIALSTFWSLRPPNLKRAQQETCLCKACENLSCYEKALQEAARLVQEAYPDEQDEDEDADEPDPMRQNDNYLQLLQFVKEERRIGKVTMCLCPEAFKNQQEACIRCKCAACGFQKIWSQGLRVELVQPDGALRPDVNPVWLKEVKWFRYKTAKETASVAVDEDEDEEQMKQQRRGTLIDLLDEFEAHAWPKYPYHRYTLHRTREAADQLRRTARPGSVVCDCDWAERYTMCDAREIQSEYWCMRQIGLFIFIARLLLTSAWQKTEGALEKGAEVTVEDPSVTDSFYATVVNEGGAAYETDEYIVRDENGTSHGPFQRRYLRHRKWYTWAFVGITGDKKQDSYATQHFITMILSWLHATVIVTGLETATRLYIHSDNAATHFKNSKTLNFLSRIPSIFTWILIACWSFGCPGHGKGPWDGLGGILKRMLRQDTIDRKLKSHSGIMKAP